VAPGWCWIHFTGPKSNIDSVNTATESEERLSRASVCVCKREMESVRLGRSVTVDHLFCLYT